jgi:16S rRNA (guanine527-N7)-methyltransferase
MHDGTPASGAAAGKEKFARLSGADAATLALLTGYERLLGEWNARVNLVAASTLDAIWTRHFLDSAQLLPLIPADAKCIVDIGSGAGFPGLVLAIVLRERPGLCVHLIEATQKKCRFLEAAAEATGAPVKVHWGRAESISPIKACAVTARAVAPLPELLALADPYFSGKTVGLFLKGQNFARELTAARAQWNFAVETHPSQSDSSGVILRVTGLRRCPKPMKRS